ncbi:MAG: helix-turn-helix domain-containing protein [Gammaproteobacteria bacterium]|nr:helix-turn-helix domain-containing protein [Gammaproteobacteria bacterium]
MSEKARRDCDWCGLRRICFPARLPTNAGMGPGALGIRGVQLPRGRALYRAGDRLDGFHMIRSGCVKEIERIAGNEAIVDFRLPGELLTVQGPAGTRSRITCVAVEPSNLCAVPWRSFLAICGRFPAVNGEMVRALAANAAGTRELLATVRDKAALERVAAFLASLCARMQVRGLPAQELRLGMGRDDIAAYLGLRSETVSRCFSELERRAVVRVRAKRVRILSAERLRRLARREGEARAPAVGHAG